MRILLMGPLPPKYTGQSVAFSSIVNALKRNNQNKCTVINLSGTDTILKGLILSFKIIWNMLFNKFDRVYFTCSRSFLGSIRDVVLLSFCRIRKILVVNHLHGADFKKFYNNQGFIYKKILSWGYDIVDTSIVLLDEMKEQFENFPNMKLKVVANGYSVLLDSLPKNKEDKDRIQLLYLSNIMHSKGIVELLEAVDILFMEYKNLNLNLIIAGLPIGDHVSDQKTIESLFYSTYNKIRENSNSKVEYSGVIYGEDKIQALWESDIFLLPTYYPTEAFPISILEAMRAGNYIISTKHNYIPNIVSERNGELIEPNSSKAIYEGILKAVKDKNVLRDIQNHNIGYAIDNYSEDIYISKVLNIIYSK